jgi:hypothetical protein
MRSALEAAEKRRLHSYQLFEVSRGQRILKMTECIRAQDALFGFAHGGSSATRRNG